MDRHQWNRNLHTQEYRCGKCGYNLTLWQVMSVKRHYFALDAETCTGSVEGRMVQQVLEE